MKAYITVKKISNRGIKSKPWYVILYDDLNQTTPKFVLNYEGFKTKKNALDEMERQVNRMPNLIPFKS